MDTKALRQKILDLAIRGKLVPQDPNDEPASVLLERIRAEKQQMVKDGRLKAKDIKNDTVIFVGEDNLHYEKFSDGSVKCIEEEIPFVLPQGWEWCRISHITSIITKGASPKWQGVNYSERGILFITSENVGNEKLVLHSPKYLADKINEIQPRSILKKHDLLTNIVGASIGRTCEYNLDEVANINQAVAILRFTNSEIIPYILKLMNSSYIVNLMLANQVNVARANLSLSSLSKFLIPLAPLKEQQRITDKLKEVINTINFLEKERSEITYLLYCAKSKILDLAIRGKLVPQDPNDEPASVLLERIRAEKEELIKQGKIKRDKKESVIFRGEDNSYYQKTGNLIETIDDWDFSEIPDNWTICCLGDLCDYGNFINIEAKDIKEDAWILDLEDIEKDTGKILVKVHKSERKSISSKHKFNKGQVLYSKLRPYLNKIVIADEDGFCTSEILPLDLNNSVVPEYVRYYLMSNTFLKYANHCSYGVKMPRLGTLDGKKAVVPLPPLNEQIRIVSTIETTFAQLDEIANAIA